MSEIKFLQKLSVKDSIKMMEVLGQLVNQRKMDAWGSDKGGFIFNEHEQRNISGIILDITDYILKEAEFPVKPQKEPYTVGSPKLSFIDQAMEQAQKHYDVHRERQAIPRGDYPPEVGHIPPPSTPFYGVLCDSIYNEAIIRWDASQEEVGARFIPIQSFAGIQKNFFHKIIKHQSWVDCMDEVSQKTFESDNLYFKVPVVDWSTLMNPPFHKFKKNNS